MAKIAATHVHVHKNDGETVVIAAGEEVPGWAHKLIDNPAVYVDESDAGTEPVPEPDPETE